MKYQVLGIKYMLDHEGNVLNFESFNFEDRNYVLYNTICSAIIIILMGSKQTFIFCCVQLFYLIN